VKNIFLSLFVLGLLQSCGSTRKTSNRQPLPNPAEVTSTVVIKNKVAPVKINVKQTDPDSLVAFAKTLVGTPYKYGSVKKADGFDCSGFVFYVFDHFKIKVPRTTTSYTNAGPEVSIAESKPGDLILFTGSDAKSGVVGHMGIITKNVKKDFRFIHAASGQNAGVMISTLNSYFIPRFVKVIRVFPN
jgi:cell wall-associated NlpC family hydrolase